MKDSDYCEIIIRYTRKMPPTSLRWLKDEITRLVSGFTPKLIVRTEKEGEKE